MNKHVMLNWDSSPNPTHHFDSNPLSPTHPPLHSQPPLHSLSFPPLPFAAQQPMQPALCSACSG